jgi:glycosyltransferase involved in cell wall biosynthesis
MRIAQIIHGVRNPSAGPTNYVAKLVDELCKLGNDASVLTLGSRPLEWPSNTPITSYNGMLERRTGISIALMHKLRELSKTPCILHGNGIWRLTNLFPLFVQKNSPAKIVWSPHGALSAWSMQYKQTIKQPFWYLLQKRALERSHCFHVTAVQEYQNVRRVGLRTPVAIIPSGVELPPLNDAHARKKRVVFLSRIDPVKGIDMLLPAWKAVANEFPEWELVIAGPLTGDYADSMQSLAHKINAPRVTFAGEVLGQAKHRLLSSASLFVLPSYSENFGIAVAEAFAHGLPVITTTRTPWNEIDKRKCGWCISPDEKTLRETFNIALNCSLTCLHEMGQNGRDWMERDYSWSRIALMMNQTYEWLLYGDSRPDFVVEF